MQKIGLPLLLVMAMVPQTLIAAPPDAGSLMRDIERKPATLPEQGPATLITPERPASKQPQGMKVLVKEFRLTGATIFPATELQAVLTPFTGRDLDLNELNQATQAVAAHYTAKGYMAQVLLPPQEVKDGVITIKVIEGKFGVVTVAPVEGVRFSKERVAATIKSSQPSAAPIRIVDVEKGLLLLNDNPGIVATATLQPGAEPGTSDLLVKLDKTPLMTGNVDFDNSGNVSTGEYRLSSVLKINNPGGFGDQLSFKALTSLDNTYGRAAYSLPLGTRGIRLSPFFSALHYTLGGDFEALDASGDALTTGLSLSVPIVRQRSGNLYHTLSYEYRQFEDDALGENISKKSIHAGVIGLAGDWRDSLFGGGYSMLSLATTLGSLDLSGNASDEATDQAGPEAAGGYGKATLSFFRLQNLYKDKTSLHLIFNGQVAGKNLDSSEKFSLGGPAAVRALPPNEGSGDEGFTISAEIHQQLSEQFQLFGFYDYGWIQQHHDTYPGWYSEKGAPNCFDVDGIGIGLAWNKMGSWSIKGTIAQRLRSNPAMTVTGDDSDGTRREPRFWIQATYSF